MLKIDINLVFTVINVIVLYLILRKFLFKPFNNMLAKRKKLIQDDFDTAAAAKTSAEDMKTQYEKQLQQIQIEREQILSDAKKQADQVYQKRIAEAEADAKALAEKTRRQLEEERRLAYVAFTRAENVLCLSDAEDGVAGESGSRYPSRFLLEMDMGELDVARGFSDDLLLAARDFIAEADRNRDLMGDFDEDESLGAVKKAPTAEFAVGDRVVHKIFGIGTVSGVDKKNFCYEITFDKFATPRSIQFDFPLSKV